MKDSNSIETAFLEVLEGNKKLVFKVANAYCQHAEDRRDLVQEIILQLWKAYPNFDARLTLSTWMYRIALNVSISYLRKEGTRQRRYTEYQYRLELLTTDEPDDPKLQLMYQMIEQLNPLEKGIIILYLDGLKNPEIAAVTGLSESNVSTKLNRIKSKLSATVRSKKL